MVELSFRLIVAGVLVLISGWLGIPSFDISWKAAVVFMAYSAFGYAMERKEMKNAGVAGFFAVADSLTLAILIGSTHHLSELGFLVLAPCAYAAAKYGSLPSAMAPIAAGSLYVAYSIFNQGDPDALFYAQSLGVLAVGMLLNHRRIVVTVTRDVIGTVEPLSPQAAEPEGFLALRENFRKVKDLYRELERKSRRDRLSVQILETRFPNGEQFQKRVAARLRELIGCESLNLYLVAQFEELMVPRASAGPIPQELENAALNVSLGSSHAQIQSKLEREIGSLLSEDDRSRVASVLLINRGKVVGMVTLFCDNFGLLDECRIIAQELAPITSALLVEESGRIASERRLRETELLYDTAVVSAGADTPNTVASRVTRELREILEVDHVGVFWIDGEEEIQASVEGMRGKLIDAMSFAAGSGLSGWLKTGAPELILFQTLEDQRCSDSEAIKRRIGSYAQIPIQFGEKPYGYLTAATNRSGGIDVRQVETLRVVAAELSRAIARLEQVTESPEGLASPKEFQRILAQSKNGCLVYLEPIRREMILESYGKPALDHALRSFARRVTAKLPAGACICRRQQGDYVVFLSDCDEKFSTSWANDIAATASMIGIRTPDGSSRMPFAIRAKVANFNTQSNEVFEKTVA